jgi:uncharacterized membrane-anchored protein
MSARGSLSKAAALAIGLALSSTAWGDIPPPKPPEPQTDNAAPAPATPPDAQTKEDAALAAKEALAKTLVKRDGVIALPGGQANVSIVDGFSYLDSADADKLLTQIWGNPPGALGNVIGAIVPRDVDVLAPSSWAAIITYDNDGHVSDSDAASIDYDDLLKQIQTGTEQANEERKKAGYPPISIVGWAQKPSYDAKEHKLYWAKHLQFGGANDTLNFAIRALGRTGVLQVNVIADMKQLPDINGQVPKLLSMVSFAQGHRYADFNESSDPVAAYGLAALVVGGVAAKAGLLKWLLAAAVASWKLIAVAIAGVGAVIARFFRSLFGGKPSTPAS